MEPNNGKEPPPLSKKNKAENKIALFSMEYSLFKVL